jgi:hypothetical protein
MNNFYKSYVAIADDKGNVVYYYKMDWSKFESPILAVMSAVYQAKEETRCEQNNFTPQYLHSELFSEYGESWLVKKQFVCDECGAKHEKQEECCDKKTISRICLTRTKIKST